MGNVLPLEPPNQPCIIADAERARAKVTRHRACPFWLAGGLGPGSGSASSWWSPWRWV